MRKYLVYLTLLFSFSFNCSEIRAEYFCGPYELSYKTKIHDLYINYHFLYPLHNIKPVAYSCFPHKFELSENLMGNFIYQVFEPLNWKNVEKHSHLLCNEQCFLVFDKHLFNQNYTSVFYINKKKFLECCNNNQTIFKEHLGKNFDPAETLFLIETGKIGFLASLHNSEYLLGILLGYGEKNSRAFNDFMVRGFPHEIPKKLRLSSIENYPLRGLNIPENPFSIVMPINFAVISESLETKKLYKKYLEKTNELQCEYRNAKFFEQIIHKINEGK